MAGHGSSWRAACVRVWMCVWVMVVAGTLLMVLMSQVWHVDADVNDVSPPLPPPPFPASQGWVWCPPPGLWLSPPGAFPGGAGRPGPCSSPGCPAVPGRCLRPRCGLVGGHLSKWCEHLPVCGVAVPQSGWGEGWRWCGLRGGAECCCRCAQRAAASGCCCCLAADPHPHPPSAGSGEHDGRPQAQRGAAGGSGGPQAHPGRPQGGRCAVGSGGGAGW